MEYVLYVLIAMVALWAGIIFVFMYLRIRAQEKTIDRLTDKLMARNYTDYVTGSNARDALTEEIHVRKPLSWYDDPNMPDVGDKT
ncbi:hypothetical protein M3661_28885 [Paenibacillus sp. MER 180]|uniref:hypothetical protein n=1 Tax=Paenibacillus sp. MER 180 TaxID=2939570 RepID=UPI00203FABF3|nr:hypothetical protein [Paenibacillus sp. MER 180]MCM3294116.1 hypothetical protein [Paenibacillus sp. MER 180]